MLNVERCLVFLLFVQLVSVPLAWFFSLCICLRFHMGCKKERKKAGVGCGWR